MRPPQAPVASDVLDRLRGAGTATIANVLLAHGLRNVMLPAIRPLSNDQRPMAGPAYTLRFMPAREDLDSMANYGRRDNPHRRAIEECPPGAVLVIDAMGSLRASSMGDMMALRLAGRGVAGAVTDGGFRDSAAIVGTGLPCYQKQHAPAATPIALHPISLNQPIGCAGVAVYPGDIVVGDHDGVVIIPQHLAADVAQAATASEEYEVFAAEQIRAGRSILDVFPATEASRTEYDAWTRSGRGAPSDPDQRRQEQ